MTTEGAAPVTTDPAGDARLFCYRHPDREVHVRCGRCDRPICLGCAMQGPVGLRCRSCGKPAVDPLTSMAPRQVAGGGLVSVAASTVGGAVALLVGGFWLLLVGFFAGGIVADLVMRVTGFKRGPVMAAVLLGGIAVGAVLALVVSYALFVGGLSAATGGEAVELPIAAYLAGSWFWAALYAGTAMAGAWGRLRV